MTAAVAEPKRVSYLPRGSIAASSSVGEEDAMPPPPKSLAARRMTIRRSTLAPRPSLWNVAGDTLLALRRSRKTSSLTQGMPTVQFENTYRLEPTKEQRLSVSKVQIAVDTAMKALLTGHEYDATGSGILVRKLCERIKREVRELSFLRYKVTVQVFIIQKIDGNSVQLSSRCLWLPEMGDNFVQSHFENSSMTVMATVFFAYKEWWEGAIQSEMTGYFQR